MGILLLVDWQENINYLPINSMEHKQAAIVASKQFSTNLITDSQTLQIAFNNSNKTSEMMHWNDYLYVIWA